MTNNIDDGLLTAYGITLADEDKPAFFARLDQLLEEAVGLAIIEKLSDEKAKELMDLTENADDETVAAWLKENAPDYDEVVDQELDTLLKEVAETQQENQ